MKRLLLLCLISLSANSATMLKGATVCTSSPALDKAKVSEFLMGKYTPTKGCTQLSVDMDVDIVRAANTVKVVRMQSGHYDTFYIAIDDLRK